MAYLTYAYCALTVAWLAYLLFRSRKLTGREIALYDYTAGESAFIRELRRHKPMMNIPVPGRARK